MGAQSYLVDAFDQMETTEQSIDDTELVDENHVAQVPPMTASLPG